MILCNIIWIGLIINTLSELSRRKHSMFLLKQIFRININIASKWLFTHNAIWCFRWKLRNIDIAALLYKIWILFKGVFILENWWTIWFLTMNRRKLLLNLIAIILLKNILVLLPSLDWMFEAWKRRAWYYNVSIITFKKHLAWILFKLKSLLHINNGCG
jgi:hypothetical protein